MVKETDEVPVGTTIYWNNGQLIRQGKVIGRSLQWPHLLRVKPKHYNRETVLVPFYQIVGVIYE